MYGLRVKRVRVRRVDTFMRLGIYGLRGFKRFMGFVGFRPLCV